MSLNGTVWAPIGPSPIDQGAITANGQVTAIAVQSEQPQHRLHRHGLGRRLADA